MLWIRLPALLVNQKCFSAGKSSSAAYAVLNSVRGLKVFCEDSRRTTSIGLAALSYVAINTGLFWEMLRLVMTPAAGSITGFTSPPVEGREYTFSKPASSAVT